jgi:hypothetical protein
VPYQQLHTRAGLTRTEVLPPAARGGVEQPPPIIHIPTARPKPRVVQMPTVVTIVLVAIGLGVAIGATLTLAAKQQDETPSRPGSASYSAPLDAPPLPSFNAPVRGVSSGRRLGSQGR